MNKQTVILDSSQIATFLECPRLWQYQHRENLVPVDAAEKDAMTMGSYGHFLLEHFYKLKAQGVTAFTAKDLTLDIDVDNYTCTCIHKKEEHSNSWSSVDEMNAGIVANSCPCNKCDCVQWEPKQLPLDADKRAIVREKFEQYVLTYCNNDVCVQSVDQVEQGFSYPLYEDDSKLYVLEGKIDLRNVTQQGQTYGFVDHKTQLRERRIYDKSVQFRNYGLVTMASISMVNYIRFTKKVDKTTFVRQPISFSGQREHDWWRQRLIGIFDRVALFLKQHSEIGAEYLLSDESQPNWAMCSGFFGYECNFTQLCNSKNVEYTQELKSRLYKIGEEWTPW